MNTRSTSLALRAIASTMIERYIFRYALLIEGVLLAIWVVASILTLVHSHWWLLLTILVIPLILFVGTIMVLSFFVHSRLRPRKLNSKESKQITEFVTEFGIKAVATKGLKKNPVALSGLIAWKYIRGRGKQRINAMLMEPINDVSGLRIKFQNIAKLFD